MSAVIEPTLAEIERAAILDRLAALEGHRTMTARSLDISLRTLTSRLHDYRLAGFAVTEPRQIEEHVSVRTCLEILNA
ncbi:MAG TPA: helix-turn-helix domain-containing protein [Tepidisphaeraceae bacterium]|jgi:DNA-binding NtrC family response regulator|nr:helix-turn-helix domain-containing protein [Tepidisphaeraceae bacterium]